MTKKKAKKLKKLKKYHYGIISSQNSLEKAMKERIKIIVSFRSSRPRYRKFQKKRKKLKKKTKKHHYGIISSPNCLENAKKVRK